MLLPNVQLFCGGAENDGHENAGHEIAGQKSSLTEITLRYYEVCSFWVLFSYTQTL